MDLLQAAEAIQRAAKMYKDMSDAADALQTIGLMDQTVRERQALINAATNQLDVVNADLLNAKSKLAEAKIQAQNVEELANEKAVTIVADAQSATDEMRRRNAAAIDESNTKSIADVTAQRTAIVQAAARVQSDLDAMIVQLAEKQASLDAVNSSAIDAENRLAKAQAAITKMLGG
jgi:hypothetical protein